MEPLEVEKAAKLMAERTQKVVEAVSDYMEDYAIQGKDPNEYRTFLRDEMIKNGIGPICAANIVRLAIYKLNIKHAKVETYTPKELKIIIEHVTHFDK